MSIILFHSFTITWTYIKAISGVTLLMRDYKGCAFILRSCQDKRIEQVCCASVSYYVIVTSYVTEFHDFRINGKKAPSLYYGIKQLYLWRVNFRFSGGGNHPLRKTCWKRKKNRVKNTIGNWKKMLKESFFFLSQYGMLYGTIRILLMIHTVHVPYAYAAANLKLKYIRESSARA